MEDSDNDFDFDFDSPLKKPSDAPLPPPRSKKTGGWADDNTSASKKSWLRRGSKQSLLRDSPKKEGPRNDSDSEIPVIPDITNFREEEFYSQIAIAPSAPAKRVVTIQELDKDLLKQSSFQSLDGIDLKLLTKHMVSEDKLCEDNTAWTWDVLFTDVSSRINCELEEKKEST